MVKKGRERWNTLCGYDCLKKNSIPHVGLKKASYFYEAFLFFSVLRNKR